MTYQDVINLIQQEIIANGNNEITADVLRPVLEEMVNFPNDSIGNLSSLNTTDQTNIVNAINEVLNATGGIVILNGTTEPNLNPPPSFSLGNFYNRVSAGGATIAYYVFNGNEWFLLANSSTPVSNSKKYRSFVDNLTMVSNDYTLQFLGDDIVGGNSRTLTMESAGAYPERILKLSNLSASVTFLLLSTTIKTLSNTFINQLVSGQSITIQSNGFQWVQI